jgi:hypothetical protein
MTIKVVSELPKTETSQQEIAHDATAIFDDLDKLRVESAITVERHKLLTSCKCSKPPDNCYFRSSPDPTLQLEATLIRHKQERDLYFFVTPNMRTHPNVKRAMRPYTLVLVTTWPIGEFYLWPLPKLRMKPIKSDLSQHSAYEESLQRWTIMTWDFEKRDFAVEPAEKMDHKPMWPTESFSDLLKLAFAGCIIDNETTNMSGSCAVSLPSLPHTWDRFRHVWLLDFEFAPDRNLLPDVLCAHMFEYRSGREISLWKNELLSGAAWPVFGPDDVVIAYSAMAEATSLQRLRRPQPNLICLFAELRAVFNGLLGGGNKRNKRKRDSTDGEDKQTSHPSLIHAVEMFGGTPPVTQAYKTAMRTLILSRKDFDAEERRLIQDYNRTDNVMARFVLPQIADHISVDHALMRGQYIWALADVEMRGLPVDLPIICGMQECWQTIRRHFIERDDEFGLYDPDLSFSIDRLENLVEARNLDWPRLGSGRLNIQARTLREQVRRYPFLKSFQRLQSQVAELRLSKLVNTLGADGYSRCSLMPFWTETGRNQPQGEKDEGTGNSDAVFLLSLPAWVRGVIQPPEGHTIVEVDFSSQEILIAAGLSGDPVLIEDAKHEPYLRFAARGGLIAHDADPKDPTVKKIRNDCKVCMLASIYGQRAHGLARRLGCSINYAIGLRQMLAQTYPVFWKWLGDVVAQARCDLQMISPFGWPLHVTVQTKTNTLLNYMAQSGGADMLRLSIIAAHRAGLKICAPLHDSLWGMFPTDEYFDQLVTLQRIMARACQSVCGIVGETKTETIVTWPACLGDIRKPDDKGAAMWAEVMGLIRSDGLKGVVGRGA